MGVQPVLTLGQLAELGREAAPRTADDVSVAWDGRRLDSREKVLTFLAELSAARDDERDGAGI